MTVEVRWQDHIDQALHFPCNDGVRPFTWGTIVHSTRGEAPIGVEYQAAINTFANCANEVSAHLIIAQDGRIAFTVDLPLAAWHAGQDANYHYLGVELEQPFPTTPYTDIQYQLLAAFVLDTSQAYQYPLDRQHIMGHEEIPQGIAQGKTDPGPMFDWSRLMYLLAYSPPPIVQQGTGLVALGLGVALAGAGAYVFARERRLL